MSQESEGCIFGRLRTKKVYPHRDKPFAPKEKWSQFCQLTLTPQSGHMGLLFDDPTDRLMRHTHDGDISLMRQNQAESRLSNRGRVIEVTGKCH